MLTEDYGYEDPSEQFRICLGYPFGCEFSSPPVPYSGYGYPRSSKQAEFEPPEPGGPLETAPRLLGPSNGNGKSIGPSRLAPLRA